MVLSESGSFSPIGMRFLDQMRATHQSWSTETVPAHAAALARDAADDHQLGWRLRNVAPDDAGVAMLARRWSAGSEPGDADVGSVTKPREHRLQVNARLDLASLRLTDPAAFDALTGDPAALADRAVSATEADLAHAARNFPAALAGYRRQVNEDPDSRHAWAGLFVAADRIPAASDALLRPEIAYAVHRRVRRDGGAAADPLALQTWLAPALQSAPQPPTDQPADNPSAVTARS